MANKSKVSRGQGQEEPHDVLTEDVVIRMRGLAPSLSPAEQRVASLILQDPQGASSRTITELAKAATTSETTVIRFCKALGLSGYPELRLRLAAESARDELRNGERVVGSDIGPDDTMQQIVEKIAYSDARAVEETVRQLDVDLLDEIAALMSDTPRVDVFGVGASGFVALDFQQKLHRIGRIAFAWPDVHVALASAALLGGDGVAFGISHGGATAETVDFLELAHSRGATTIALTNFPRSPISEVADYVLTTAARETTFRSGATASRIAQLTVVDALFVGIARRNFRGTLDALEATYDAVRDRRTSTSRRGARS